MELFTFGVANYVETDVYAAARVFTGWNLTTTGTRGTAAAYYAFNYNAGPARDHREGLQLSDLRRRQHDAFPRAAAASGMQDGLDLINALALHPETAKRLAGRTVDVVRRRGRRAGSTISSQRSRTSICRADTDIKATVRAVLDVAAVHGRRALLHAVFVAGRVRRRAR